MSIFQTLIGSAAGSTGSGPAWLYPPPGNHYPLAPQTQTAPSVIGVSGYYEASSITTSTLGLFRRTYQGQAFVGAGSYAQDPTFPASYTLKQSLADTAVGFGNDLDNASNFTMEWIGYFKPTVSGDFCFVAEIDDYFAMWIGVDAVTGFDANNAVMKADNTGVGTQGLSLVADKYYPVRLRYVEDGGGHNCSIWSGLKDVTSSMNCNQNSAATGQFF